MSHILTINDPQLDVLLLCLEAATAEQRFRDNDHYWLLRDKAQAIGIKRQERRRSDLPLPWRRAARDV